MAKPQKKNNVLANNTNGNGNGNSTTMNTINSSASPNNGSLKVKRTRKSVPRDSPSQRSSVFRGVTRHRWTGRYEAHLWDKNCWNESQNKKGRQGAYDDEEAAAHAYDLAALKYWGHDTILNFPLSTYQEELKEMEGQSKEEYIGSLRRKSSGFSRGVSKYRGVARHHHNGRWEARIGRVFGNKYLYLGTYATQEEAATAYDMAAIEYRAPSTDQTANELARNSHRHNQQSSGETPILLQPRTGANTASSALGLLLQSSKFKEMLERTSAAEVSPMSPPESDNRPSRCSFPEDIQTYFECQDGGSFAEGDDAIFGDINSFTSPIFQCELDTLANH
ncbi:hypothetical protein J5N97_003270 [Dioscorea zingiberensis]|uniref:AP2/ERF domain-containing protein n=1 Tax=Dioscorea zingiberensis TaxID=325984 RepID=A0A9D5D594_9LILI|nr:hypothetical protein J5N97_003270 [Dioscorea zingiberensis]